MQSTGLFSYSANRDAVGGAARRSRAPVWAAAALAALTACAGCSHPAAWLAQPDLHLKPGLIGPNEVAGYDTDRDCRLDYLQVYSDAGVKRRLMFDTGRSGGAFDLVVDLDKLPDGEARYLFVLLDGVSFDLVAELYAEGHFRLFYPPGRLIPRFPTETDTVYADFFETPRPYGAESLYFDKETNRLVGGDGLYLAGTNEPVWPQRVLFRQNFFLDGLVYAFPDWIAGRELDKSVAAACEWLQNTSEPYAAIYMVNPDALAHKQGAAGLKKFLLRVDEALEQLVWRSRGRLRIVCLADHGINEAPMKRARVAEGLRKAGFRLTDRLQGDRDVVVPEYGLLSLVAISCRRPAEVAEAAAKVQGVDLAIYPDGGAFAVRSAAGAARVEASPDGRRHRYLPSQGDPLRLLPIIAQMKAAGKIDTDGWADGRAWLDATWDHDFPDPLVRIATAFEGNVRHPADVLLSLAPEYYCGKSDFDAFASLRGTHGSLHKCATTTFVLSNFFTPPPYQRMTGLRDFLKQRLGWTTLLPPERSK